MREQSAYVQAVCLSCMHAQVMSIDLKTQYLADGKLCTVGVAQPLCDVLARLAHGSCQEAAGSLLLLGPPGVGKALPL